MHSVSTELPQRHCATVLQGSTGKNTVIFPMSPIKDTIQIPIMWMSGRRSTHFTKFKIESEFQNKSLGGAISYVEVPNLTNNVEAIEEVIRFIYDNIQYGEFNTKSDYCQVCGYDGEIMINDNMEWECPSVS